MSSPSRMLSFEFHGLVVVSVLQQDQRLHVPICNAIAGGDATSFRNTDHYHCFEGVINRVHRGRVGKRVLDIIFCIDCSLNQLPPPYPANRTI